MIVRRLLACLPALALAACTSGQVGQLPSVTRSNPASFKLQMAVGVATYVDTTANTHYGFNVVETFRNAAGDSATTTNTPTLSGPPNAFAAGSFPVSTLSGLTPTQAQTIDAALTHPTPAPSPSATAGIPSLASYAPKLPNLAAFGLTTGAFGYGFAGDNLVDPVTASSLQSFDTTTCPEFTPSSLNVTGGSVPYNSLHYGILKQPLATDVFSATPGLCQLTNALANDQMTTMSQQLPYPFVGGPPAWPSAAGYGTPIAFPGYSSGFTTIVPCSAVGPFSGGTGSGCSTVAPVVPGTYSLDVAVSQGGSSSNQYTHFDASAQLPPATVASPLPAVPQPVVNINADGTGLVNVDVPSDPRITETIVYIGVPDCGLGFLPPAGNEVTHYYSLITKTQGQQTLFISNLGPPSSTGQPTHTFCNAADATALANLDTASSITFSYTIFAVSFDYPAFEASYPANTQQMPTIAGASNTADLSMSEWYNCPAYTPPAPGSTVTCGTTSQ